MSELLPWMFIFGAVAAMLAALVSLWMSITLGLSREAGGAGAVRLKNDARLALMTEKEALLQEIWDIAFERDAGKLSDRDFEELNEKLRAQARHVLSQLDAGAEEFREEAEALIAERLGQER